MNTYHAIIIDDEPNVSKALELIIEDEFPEINLIANCTSAKEGREAIARNQVEFIFLDINMPEENGFEFLDSIGDINAAIIFITAYQEYALKAFKANAVDYLLKPVSSIELKEAIEKAKYRLKESKLQTPDANIYSQSVENLIRQMQSNSTAIQKITVAEQFGFRIVDVEEIRYLEADGNYTIIH